MTGYMYVMGECFTCKRIFTFSPTKVPSLPASLTGTGEKEPVCESCVLRANPERIKNGLPEIVILDGAYDADPC